MQKVKPSALRTALEKFNLDTELKKVSPEYFKGGRAWRNDAFHEVVRDLRKLSSDTTELLAEVNQMDANYAEMRRSYMGGQRDLLRQLLPEGAVVSESDEVPGIPFDELRKRMPTLKKHIDHYETKSNEVKKSISVEEENLRVRINEFRTLSEEEFNAKDEARVKAGVKLNPNPLHADPIKSLKQLNENFGAAFERSAQEVDRFASIMNEIESEREVFEQELAAYRSATVKVEDEYRYRPEWKDAAEDAAFHDRYLPTKNGRADYQASEEDPHPRESFINKPWLPPPN